MARMILAVVRERMRPAPDIVSPHGGRHAGPQPVKGAQAAVNAA